MTKWVVIIGGYSFLGWWFYRAANFEEWIGCTYYADCSEYLFIGGFAIIWTVIMGFLTFK